MPQKISIDDETIKQIVKPDLERARQWQDELRPQREQAARLYAMDKQAVGLAHLNREGWSQVVAPLVYESVEGMKVGLDQLFTSPDFFDVKVGKNAEAGERIRKLIRWNIFEAQYGARQVRWWLDSCLKYHYGVLKVFWDEEYREDVAELERVDQNNAAQLEGLVSNGYRPAKYREVFEQVQTVDELGQMVVVDQLAALENVKLTKDTPVFIGPRILAVDPEAFFYSPDSDDLDKCRVVAHRTARRLEDIKRGELDGRFRKGSYAKVREKLGADNEMGSAAAEDDNYRYDVVGLPSPAENATEDAPGGATGYGDGGGMAAVEPSRKLELWEIYTSIDIDRDGLLEPVIIHMAHDVILNVQENPYRRPPFRIARAIESPWRLEGVPYPKSLEQLTVEITQQTRLWNDSTASSVYATMLTDDQQLADQWRNRQVDDVLLSSSNTIAQKKFEIVRTPPPDPSILKAMELLEGRAERVSGVTRYNQGIDANSLNKTATGIQTIATLAQQRQKYTANVISEAWKDAIEDVAECFKTFGKPYVEYFAGKGNEIDPNDYANDFTVTIELGIGPQEKAQQAGVLMQLIGMAQMAIPAGLMNVGHVAKILDRIGQLKGIPLESYHFSEQEIEQKEQQKAMQQQLQQQAMQQMAQEATQNGQATRQAEAGQIAPTA